MLWHDHATSTTAHFVNLLLQHYIMAPHFVVASWLASAFDACSDAKWQRKSFSASVFWKGACNFRQLIAAGACGFSRALLLAVVVFQVVPVAAADFWSCCSAAKIPHAIQAIPPSLFSRPWSCWSAAKIPHAIHAIPPSQLFWFSPSLPLPAPFQKPKRKPKRNLRICGKTATFFLKKLLFQPSVRFSSVLDIRYGASLGTVWWCLGPSVRHSLRYGLVLFWTPDTVHPSVQFGGVLDPRYVTAFGTV